MAPVIQPKGLAGKFAALPQVCLDSVKAAWRYVTAGKACAVSESRLATGEHHANRTERPEEASGRDRRGCHDRQDRDRRNPGHEQAQDRQDPQRDRRSGCACQIPVTRGAERDRQEGRRREVGVMHAYSPLVGYRSEKAAQVVAYFLLKGGGKMDKLKLVKLLYLTERESAQHRGRPMLYDEYYSLKHGPICSSSLNGLNGELDVEVWSRYIAKDGRKDVYVCKGVAQAYLDQLSRSDIDIIARVWESFGWMTASQIRNWTHRHCAEYVEVEAGRLPITLKQMALAIGYPDADAFENEVAEYRSAELALPN